MNSISRYDYEVRCRDVCPDGADEFTVVVAGRRDARSARDYAEQVVAPRMARAGALRGTLVAYSAKRITDSAR